MTSTINPALPVQGAGATTQSIRDNFQNAKNDIEALQSGTNPITGNLTVEGNIYVLHPGGGIIGSYATLAYAQITSGITASQCSGDYLAFSRGYFWDGFVSYYASGIYHLYATYVSASQDLYCSNYCSGYYLAFSYCNIGDGLSAYSCSGSYLSFDHCRIGGTSSFSGSATFYSSLYVQGTPYANQSQFSPLTSMRAAKEDIEPYERGLDGILKLQPVTYRYNGLYDSPDNGSFYHGLIAEDVGTVMPEMVKYRTPEIQTVDTSPLIYAVVNSLKEHERRITALENR